MNTEELLAKAKKPSADAMKLHPFYRGKIETTLKCVDWISSLPARSAMVRASFRMW